MEKERRFYLTPLTIMVATFLLLGMLFWRFYADFVPAARAGDFKGIPVLMYHKVNPNPETGNLGLRVNPDDFEWQMRYLFEQGYQSISLRELRDYVEEGKPIPPKSMVITFDDGYKDNYIYALPIMEKYGFTATIFVVVNTIGKVNKFDLGNQPVNQMMDWDEIKDTVSRGFTIGSHTMDHQRLWELSQEKALYQIRESKEVLEKGLGLPVKYFCYPYGSYSKIARKMVIQCGYEAATTTNSGLVNLSDDIYTLKRVYVSGQMSHEKFTKKILNANQVTEVYNGVE